MGCLCTRMLNLIEMTLNISHGDIVFCFIGVRDKDYTTVHPSAITKIFQAVPEKSKVVNDGVTIGKAIELPDAMEMSVLSVASKTNDLAGDAIASISVENGDVIGTMIADAIDKVGSDGVLSIESSYSFETAVNVEE
ncbi:RuBisCO large subunit-binding protein subunit alpha [Tanacetum coccineum]